MARAWGLAIDFGTSFTVAASRSRERLDVLDLHGERRMPSTVCLTEDGKLLVGEKAEARAGMAPDRVERTPKRLLDVGQPAIVLGGQLLQTTNLVGAVLSEAWNEALRQHDSLDPRQVRLTHPASWGEERLSLLRGAAALAGIKDPLLLSEPEAAAVYLASEESGGSPIVDGDHVAVYDLGGGTFDTAVLRRDGDRFVLVGEASGDKQIGGELFDDRLHQRLGESGLEPEDWNRLRTDPTPEWRHANWEFRRQVRQAKESVSQAATHPVFVPSPLNRTLQVSREEFEDLIRPDIERTLDILDLTIRGAGVSAEALAGLYLVGGSSRIPLVARMVQERFGRADTKGEPKATVALGGALRTEPGPDAAPEERRVTTKPEPETSGLPSVQIGGRPVPLRAILAGALVIIVALVLLLPKDDEGNGENGDSDAKWADVESAEQAAEDIALNQGLAYSAANREFQGCELESDDEAVCNVSYTFATGGQCSVEFTVRAEPDGLNTYEWPPDDDAACRSAAIGGL